jgi:hypothetical protein
MANYYSQSRSNYFRVKDEDAFLADMEDIPGIEVQGNNENGFVILGDDPDGANTWAKMDWDDVEYDIPEIVSKHLIDDEVAIFMEVGSEKLRYLVGVALAINNKGETEQITLADIYAKAKKTLTYTDVTVAEY